MKKSRHVFLLTVIFSLYPVSVLANSSWHWVTVSPMKVLPFAVILTLLTEWLGILKFGKVSEKLNTFFVVLAANIFSFVAPYVYRTIKLYSFYGGLLHTWERMFNNGPNYIIRSMYLFLTLFIEVPLAYLLLKNKSKNKKRLIFAVIFLNIITTFVVAVLERLICRGVW